MSPHAPAGAYESNGQVSEAVPFTHLLLTEDAPLLLMALGCVFAGGRPQVSGQGETSVAGVFAAGPALHRNAQFALWRVRWPAKLARIPSTATQALVEP